MWGKSRSYDPAMEAAKRDALYGRWKLAVTKSFGWVDEAAAAGTDKADGAAAGAGGAAGAGSGSA